VYYEYGVALSLPPAYALPLSSRAFIIYPRYRFIRSILPTRQRLLPYFTTILCIRQRCGTLIDLIIFFVITFTVAAAWENS